jgi:hypothetical protein
MKTDLPFIDGPLVENFGWDGFGCDINPLGLGLVQGGWEQAHLELEGQDVHARGSPLAALRDDLLHKKAAHREIDRPDNDQPGGALPVKEAFSLQRLGLVGF